MYRIGILDDEKIWGNRIADKVKNCFVNNGEYEYKIIIFTQSDELYKFADKIDLLFLDIELGEKDDGFDVAQKIQSINKKVRICFLTSHLECAREGYKYNAFRYLDKTHLEEVEEAINVYLRKKAIVIVCKTADYEEKPIISNDIIYLETYGRKLCYHMQNSEKLMAMSNIKDAYKLLKNYGFVQIHRSYIVNMEYIDRYDSRQMVLKDRSVIPVSRERISDFRKIYFEWRKNQID